MLNELNVWFLAETRGFRTTFFFVEISYSWGYIVGFSVRSRAKNVQKESYISTEKNNSVETRMYVQLN